MRPALIATPIFVLTAIAVTDPAQALPGMPPPDTLASRQAPLLLSVRYDRHYPHQRRHRAVASRTERDGDGIKPGQWQFTSELLAPAPASGTQSSAPASRPASSQSQPETSADNGAKSTYLACITSDKAVPAGIDPRCKLDGTERQGSRISWSMSCANTHVRSDGIAQYHGDTMDGTMTSHVPNASGAAMDMTQRITGRYVRPCTQSAPSQMMPAEMMQAATEAGSSQPQAGQQSAEPARAAPQQAGDTTAAIAQPERLTARHARHHARYRHYARHHHRRYYRRWY